MWQALLPLLIFLSTSGGIFEETSPQDEAPASPVKDRHTSSTSGSKSTLLLLTVSGVVAVYAHLGSISAVALGLSYAVLQVLAFHLVERARAAAQHHVPNGGSVIYSASGLLTQPTKPPVSSEEQWLSLIRDVSTGGALTTGVAALTLESLRFGGLAYYGLLGQAMGDHWVFGQGVLSLVYALGTIIVHMAMYGALLLTVSFACLLVSDAFIHFIILGKHSPRVLYFLSKAFSSCDMNVWLRTQSHPRRRISLP